MKMGTRILTIAAIACLAVAGTAAGKPAAESARLSRAKDFIADEQWPRAIEELKAAVGDAKEPNKDEALFWLAHSQYQAGDPGAAIDTIGRLERSWPVSRWVKPARSLRVEIAQRLGRDDVLWWTASPPAPPAPPAAMAPTAPPRLPSPPRSPRPAALTPVAAPPPAPAPPAPGEPPAPPAATTRPPAMVFTPQPPEGSALPRRYVVVQPATPGQWITETFSPDTDLRIQALGSLMPTHPDRVIPLLKDIALDAGNPGEARRALFVLAQSDRPEARVTVLQVARQAAEPVRIAAVRELGRFGGAGVSSDLLQVYATATTRVKTEIVTSLGERADTVSLLRIANTEGNLQVRNSAIVTLARAGAREQLRALYTSAPRGSRQAVLVALFNARDEDELIRIAERESDPLLRQEALRRLRLLGTDKARRYLSTIK